MGKKESTDDTPPLTKIVKNNQILLALNRDASVTMSDIANEIDASTSTANRRLNQLADLGLIKMHKDGRGYNYELTHFGETISDWLQTGAVLWESRRLYTALSDGASIPPWVLTGGSIRMASEKNIIKDAIFDQIFDVFCWADHLRFVAPTLTRDRTFSQIANQVRENGLTVEMAVTQPVLDVLQSRYPEKGTEVFNEFNNQLFILSAENNVSYCFGIGYKNNSYNDITDSKLAMICYDDQQQTALGTVVNEAPSAVAWAEKQYESCRKQTTDQPDDVATGGNDLVFPFKEEADENR